MMVKVAFSLFRIVIETLRYQACLLDYVLFKRLYTESVFYEDNRHAKVHCFSIYLMMKFINDGFYTTQKHYRSDSFLEDMKANLKNVAIPGTGIPLSYFVFLRPFLWFFIIIFVPFICLCGAIHQTYQDFVSDNDEGNTSNKPLSWEENLFSHFHQNLLTSNNWFTLWRHNTHLVTYHSYLSHSQDYEMEDKWKFLKIGKELNIPISPYFDDVETIVCKNILIEGGMGIHFYKNAIFGGHFIIQEKLKNALWLNELLPKNAPLSTMRIITTSVFPLSKDFNQASINRLIRTEEELNQPQDLPPTALSSENDIVEGNPLKTSAHDLTAANFSYCSTDDGWKIGVDSRDEQHPKRIGISNQGEHFSPSNSETGSTSGSRATPRQPHFHHHHLSSDEEKEIQQYIRAETAVLRLGRMNALTDHSSILFNVNLRTGEIEPGQVNSHWYQLGLDKIWTTSWLPPVTNIRNHLDPPYPEVAGKFIPDMQEAVKIVTSSHYKMMPEVPIVGWDVAFTTKGIFLLEVNLSCNFFCGKFDLDNYVQFLHEYWVHLEKLERVVSGNADSGGIGAVDASASSATVASIGKDSTKKYKRHSFKVHEIREKEQKKD